MTEENQRHRHCIILWIAGGVHFWRIRDGQRSREWMALALVLGGIGAALAGTSYQLLGYELKCAGRNLCLWTHWLEVAYMMLQAASTSAMLIAVACACTVGALRRCLAVYAVANTVVYMALATYGALAGARASPTGQPRWEAARSSPSHPAALRGYMRGCCSACSAERFSSF